MSNISSADRAWHLLDHLQLDFIRLGKATTKSDAIASIAEKARISRATLINIWRRRNQSASGEVLGALSQLAMRLHIESLQHTVGKLQNDLTYSRAVGLSPSHSSYRSVEAKISSCRDEIEELQKLLQAVQS